MVAFVCSETPFEGVEGPFIDITPGDDAAGPPGNGHAPTVGVRVSTDAGNTIVAGADGGLYATLDCAAVIACVPAAPAETPNSTTNANPGVTVSLSGPFNRNIEVAVAAQAPTAGCGITVSGTTVSAKTLGWTFACADTNGAPVHCDANGFLRTVPEHTCAATPRASVDTPLGTATTGMSDPATVTLINPSPCRSMVVSAFYTNGGSVAIPVSDVATDLFVGIGLSYTGSYRTMAMGSLAAPGVAGSWQNSNNDVGTIPPSGGATVSVRGIISASAPRPMGAQATAFLTGCTV